MRLSPTFLFAGAALMPLAAAHAQKTLQVGVASGVTIPTDRYGQTRTPGPLVRGTLWVGDARRHVRARLDLEYAWMLGEVDPALAGSSSQGTMTALSVIPSVVVGGTDPRFAPYVIVGLGPQQLHVKGAYNPYGTTFGGRAGVGGRWQVAGGRATMHAEVAKHWAFTDFGTGRDFAAGSYVPLVVGVSF